MECDNDCGKCEFDFIYGEDVICLEHYKGETREEKLEEFYRSQERIRLNNAHWESLVGPINELGE